MVAGFQKGLPLRIIAPASVFDGTVPQVAVVVSKTSPLQTAKDLEGKTIATNPIRGISSFAMNLWMRKHGADPSTIKWIEMPRGDMAAAITQGHIDAATMTEPFLSINRSLTRIIAVPYSAVAPRFVTVVFIATEQWIKSSPDLVHRFASTIDRTAAWANANETRSGTILATYSKMSPALINQMSRVKYATGLRPAELQPCIDLASEGKLIDAPFPAAELLY